MPSKRTIFTAQLVCGLLMFVTVYSAFGFIQLHNISGVASSWTLSPENTVTYTINSTGSDNIADKGEDLAIRMAFDSWNQVSSSRIQFVEDTANRSNTNLGDPNTHMVIFDENNSTGYFPGQSGIIAITPVSINTATGQILDADIIFNGKDHSFSADGTSGTFDVQSIAVHEIGHFLGLDHTAVRNATMFPYSQPNEYQNRSLSTDDMAGATKLYPQGPDSNTVTGTILDGSGAPLRGAHVVALSAVTGAVEASTATDAKGMYTLSGLTERMHYIYAEPLDGPVTKADLTLPSVDSNFATAFYGGNSAPSQVTGVIGTLIMPAVNGMNIHQVSPTQINQGQLVSLMFKADGFTLGQTLLKFSHPGITIQGAVQSTKFVGWYRADIQIDSQVPLGLYNIMIQDGQNIAILTGGVEVVSLSPDLTGLNPTSGSKAGGTLVTLTGQSFQGGARVIFGDQFASSVSFVDQTTITAISPAVSVGGTVRVMIINPDGQFAVIQNGFGYIAGLPSLNSLSPVEGASAGGTQLTLNGANFLSGATVTIGGKTASISSLSATKIICETPSPIALGSVDVVVTNPGGYTSTITGGFTYIAPSITQMQPNTGQYSGGTFVILSGKGFDPKGFVMVTFGSQQATAISVPNEQTIYCTTPAGTAGPVDVTVTNTKDGQAVTILGGYTYLATLDPMITSISPTSGSSSGGTSVTILGQNFASQTRVYIGSSLAQINSISDGKIVLTTPSGPVGAQNVVVENSLGQQAIRVLGFTYFASVSTGGGGGGGGGCVLSPQPLSSAGLFGRMLPLLLLLGMVFVLRKKALTSKRKVI